MHDCDRYREALSARLDGEDSGMSQSVIDAHLAGCSDCRSWAEAAGALSPDGSAAPGPALRPGVMSELLDLTVDLRDRQRGDGGWRVGLLAVAVLQLVVAWPGLLPGDGIVSAHAAHELASWDLGLAVGFLALAWMPGRAWGALPVVAAMVLFLTGTSISDILAGHAELEHEVTHALQLAGLLCLWMVARRNPRSSFVLRLNAP